MAVQPLSWSDIDAWARLTRRELDPTDVEAIRRIDTVYCNHAHAVETERQNRSSSRGLKR